MPRTYDDTWSKDNARKAEENFRLFRQRENQEKQEERLRLSVNARAQRVALELQRIQHTPCKPLERAAPSVDKPVPHIDMTIASLEPRVYRRLLHDLRSHDSTVALAAVEVLEEAILEHKGFLRFESKEEGSERDRRLLQTYVGYHPAQIRQIEPGLGDVKTIKRVRTLAGCDPLDGHAIDGQGS